MFCADIGGSALLQGGGIADKILHGASRSLSFHKKDDKEGEKQDEKEEEHGKGVAKEKEETVEGGEGAEGGERKMKRNRSKQQKVLAPTRTLCSVRYSRTVCPYAKCLVLTVLYAAMRAL